MPKSGGTNNDSAEDARGLTPDETQEQRRPDGSPGNAPPGNRRSPRAGTHPLRRLGTQRPLHGFLDAPLPAADLHSHRQTK